MLFETHNYGAHIVVLTCQEEKDAANHLINLKKAQSLTTVHTILIFFFPFFQTTFCSRNAASVMQI